MIKRIDIFGFLIKKIICFLILFFIFSINDARSQIDISSKEEIKITSNFKPSIIKKKRILFFTTPPEKDSSSFRFIYTPADFFAKTKVKSFSLSPINILDDNLNPDSSGFYSKVGYGNIHNPFAQFAFEDQSINRTISIWANHISAKGLIQHQQYSNSSLGSSFRSTLNENQSLMFNFGYDLDRYHQYGFDHNAFKFNDSALNKKFNYFYNSISFSSLSKDGKSIISPTFYYSNLSMNKGSNENSFELSTPISYSISDHVSIQANPKYNYVIFNKSKFSSTKASVLQFPLKGVFKNDFIAINGGINSIFNHSKMNVLPALDLNYTPKKGNLTFLLEVANKVSVNSIFHLSNQNPFILFPDTLSIFKQIDYGAGIKIALERKFSFKVIGGYSRFMNLPTYINLGPSGKDFKVAYLPQTSAFKFFTELMYSPNTQFDVRASLNSYTFSSSSSSPRVYGFIPTDLSVSINWMPINGLKLVSAFQFWKGSWAFSEKKSVHKLKNITDISLDIEYDINKKWGIWLDLNNIANVKYERWSQYDVFGFNLSGGLRYKFINKK